MFSFRALPAILLTSQKSIGFYLGSSVFIVVFFISDVNQE